MNRADRNVNMYACRKATNSSSRLSANAPKMLAGATPQIQTLLQAADARPTPQATDAVKELTERLLILEQRWARIK